METEGIGELSNNMCSDMQSDIEKMCSSLHNDTCGGGMSVDEKAQ